MRKYSKPLHFFRHYIATILLVTLVASQGRAQVGFGNTGGITKKHFSQPFLTGTGNVYSTSNSSLLISEAFSAATTAAPVVYSCPTLPSQANGGPYVASTQIQNIITFSLIEESNNIIPAGFSATINFTVAIGSGQATPETLTVGTTAANAGTTNYSAKNYITFTGGQSVSIVVTSITATTTNGTTTTGITTLPSGQPVQSIVKLENEFDVTNFCNLTDGAPSITVTTEANPESLTQDELPISWQWPSSEGNNYTQLEWVWLENELLNTYPNDGTHVTNTALLFTNNATRVDIPEGYNANSYNIPLLYDGTGVLYYRVRAVNVLPGGGITTGAWYTTGDPASTGMPTPYSFNGHNNNLNWQVTTSFAEEGKRKSVIQYYDGSLRGRQTVTKDNTTNTVVTAETFYDLQGRAAIQILPTPGITGTNNIIAYRQNLNLFNSQAAGTDPAQMFDLVGVSTPNLVSTDGSAQYYSGNNGDLPNSTDGTKNIPDAGGYPFSQTVYTPDATGRIASQGGVGANYQIGSNHETKYFYGTPTQEELDGLFGTEVGYKEHYFKNMVVDANGQGSVSYIDMHGRTIATALSGGSPNGMKAINNSNTADYPNQGANPIAYSNLLTSGENVIKGNTVESVTSIMVTTPNTPYVFNYTLPGGSYQAPGCTTATPAPNLNYPYVYDLEITMVDDATGLPVTLQNNTPFDVTFTSINSESTLQETTLPLAAGTYTVRKTLTLRTDNMQTYLQTYLQPGVGFCNSQLMMETNYYTALQASSGCNITGIVDTRNVCLELNQPAGPNNSYPSGIQLYLNDYYSRLGVTAATATTAQQAAANAALADEQANCNTMFNTPVSHRLDDIKAAMLADMVPFAGQYATDPISSDNNAGLYSPVTGQYIATTGLSMYLKYNIFSTDASRLNSTPGQLPYYQFPVSPSLVYPIPSTEYTTEDNYYDANGNPAAIMTNNTLTGLSAATFSQKFASSWAASLLPYHPEYPKFLFAKANQAAFYDWVDAGLFAQTTTMAQAIQNGFINAQITDQDPFFAIAGTSLQKQSMLTSIGLSSTVTNPPIFSFWQQAYGDVMCPNTTYGGTTYTTDDQVRTACFENAPSFAPGYGSLQQAQLNEWNALIANTDQTQADLVWNKFKQLYLTARETMINKYINDNVPLFHENDGSYDDDNLVTQGFMLHFPKNIDQAVRQTGGSAGSSSSAASPQVSTSQPQWYLPQGTNSNNSPVQGIVNSQNTQNSANVAQGYIPIWTNELMQNSDIANSPNASAIISALIGTVGTNGGLGTGFLGICQIAVDAAHPAGATNSLTPNADGLYSFEKVFTTVIQNYGLTESITCNPYVIKFPKPYTAAPQVSMQETGVIDICTCQQYSKLLTAAGSSVYINGVVDLGLLNSFIRSTDPYSEWGNSLVTYGTGNEVSVSGPITPELFAGLQSCGVNGNALPTFTIDNTTTPATTLQGYVLPSPQPLPQFLECGFDGAPQCLTCNAMNTWSNSFVSIFPLPTGYTTVPLIPANGTSLTQAEINYDILYENYLNYQTGFQFSWADYQNSLTANNCSITLCSANSVPQSIDVTGNGSDQPTGGYVAGALIDIDPGFDYAATGTAVLDFHVDPNQTICGGNNTNGSVAIICPNLLPQPLNSGAAVTVQNPCQYRFNFAAAQAAHDYQNQYNQLAASFIANYMANGLATMETFNVSYQTSEYHYTLYYYDMAGNLVKTVPPKGVHPIFDNTTVNPTDQQSNFLLRVAAARATAKANGGNYNTPVVPAHTLVTNYRYNSLNQMVAQNTPDAGTSQFWYDALARLAVSQNAKQYAAGNYSYTLYDVLGRITEVGEKPQAVAMTQAISQDANNITDINDVNSLAYWLATYGGNTINNKEQITRTTYDFAYQPLSGDADAAAAINITTGLITQQNLRNRVSYSEVFNTEPPTSGPLTTSSYHASATYYTYDIHGNVNELLQDYGSSLGTANKMNQTSNRFKTMTYNYDLISGKVNAVAYQAPYTDANGITYTYTDAVYHKYSYDAENRLTYVETSRDNIYYERDASYSYYKHGPLMQTTLGKLQVQQLNYAYTLQGWLKGVNAGWATNTITPTGNTPASAYGYSLEYYSHDYTPIGGSQAAATVIFNGLGTAVAPLYNGNIAAMAVCINVPGLTVGSSNINNPMVYNYVYDQLNRLVSMAAYTGTAASGTTAAFTGGLTGVPDYGEAATYDPNGNITSYTRNGFSSPAGSATQIDNLTYNYISGTNRLSSITDADGAAHAGMGDIGTQNAGNYGYDAIGNLTGNVTDGIGTTNTDGTSKGDGITWTVYGKIYTINKTDGTVITYTYDVAGNRISKAVAKGGVTTNTFYVRDASGNVMSIYSQGGTGTVNSGDLSQIEIPIYGSSRLGEIKPGGLAADVQNGPGITTTANIDNTPIYFNTFTRGLKIFELSNHLGNVLVTISDKKIAVPASGGATIASCNADVVTANDYYPFGMLQPGRQFTAATGSGYRYGFNGKENENDIDAGVQDYGMRIYDGRIGKFLSVDPLSPKYPELTPYQFASNTPIQAIDLDGGEASGANSAPVPTTTGNESEGQQTTTGETSMEPAPAGHGSAVVTRFQQWVYHEGGFQGSKAGWMTQEDYYEKIEKPLGKAENSDDDNLVYAFVLSRKANPGLNNLDAFKSYISSSFANIQTVADFVKANPTYDSWARYVPIWGSFKQASLDFSAGNWGWGTFNAALGVSDVFLVKSVFQGALKGGVEALFMGNAKWSARPWIEDSYRSLYLRKGFAEAGQPLHHWLIQRNGPIGKYFPGFIKNQMFNLKLFEDQAAHTIFGHGKAYLGQPGASFLGQLWYGTPTWPKLFISSYGGKTLNQFNH